MTAEKQPGVFASIPGERRPALPSVDVERLVLHVVAEPKLSVDVRDVVTEASLTRTIEGASLLQMSVLDSDRTLLRSGRLSRAIDVQLDGLWFRLAHVGKKGDVLELTFEDREVAALRRFTRPRKASRAKMTRAQFAQALVLESRKYPVRFWTPELSKRQPVATASREERDATRRPGIGDDASLTVKGARADRRQLRNAELMLDKAEELGATALPRLALICAGIGESTLGADPNTFGGKYQGVLQGQAALIDVRDPAELAEAFLKGGRGFQAGGAMKLARENPGISAGEIATRVEASGKPASFYDAHREEARAIIAAYGGSGGASRPSTYYARYEFTRGEPGGPRGENTWDCLGRLAEEVGWRRFMVAGTVFFAAEEDLFRGRPRARLTEFQDGILGVDFDLETNDRVASECKVTCLADRWAAPPGSVVQLDAMGPADGRWLVVEIERPDLFDPETIITLRKPAEELPEPRPEQRTRDTDDTSTVASGDGYPLRGTRGKLIGVPYAGMHTLGNWQSDNAVDLGTPDGTIVQAVADGRVTKVKGSYSGGASRFDGYQITIDIGGNTVWYTHLSRASVREGQTVKTGQAIGRSGSANGVPHLHFACQTGDPRDLIGLNRS